MCVEWLCCSSLARGSMRSLSWRVCCARSAGAHSHYISHLAASHGTCGTVPSLLFVFPAVRKEFILQTCMHTCLRADKRALGHTETLQMHTEKMHAIQAHISDNVDVADAFTALHSHHFHPDPLLFRRITSFFVASHVVGGGPFWSPR